jgi:5-methylcytosine-specific restriction endonuclease McrA
MPRKPCLRCKTLTTYGPRCEQCSAKHKAAKLRDYGTAHKAARATLIPNATHCASCGKAFGPHDTKTLGHIVPRRFNGQSVMSNYEVQCTSCNYAWHRRDPNW